MDNSEGNSGHRKGAGYTVRGAAAAAGISYKTMLAAVRLKQVRVVSFGGLDRVPATEVQRIRELFADAT